MSDLGVSNKDAAVSKLVSMGVSADNASKYFQQQQQRKNCWNYQCQCSRPTELTADCLLWLGVFAPNRLVTKRGTIMDSFCALLEEKLCYLPGERDMVLMQHM
jgi:hypothetical protein